MSATTPGSPLDHAFAAALEKDGAYATFVTVHGSKELLGTGKATKIGGTIDGHAFEATLMPSGTGPHMLPLRKAICEAIGKSEAGEQVTIHLQRRFS